MSVFEGGSPDLTFRFLTRFRPSKDEDTLVSLSVLAEPTSLIAVLEKLKIQG